MEVAAIRQVRTRTSFNYQSWVKFRDIQTCKTPKDTPIDSHAGKCARMRLIHMTASLVGLMRIPRHSHHHA